RRLTPVARHRPPAAGARRRRRRARRSRPAAVTCVVAIDAGTTGVRALAFDEHGTPGPAAYREFTQYFPQPGCVEHDAGESRAGPVDVLGEVAAAVRDRGDTIAAVGITTRRETTVVWDRTSGRPLHRAIVWQDRRTAGRCDALRAAGDEPLVRRA